EGAEVAFAVVAGKSGQLPGTTPLPQFGGVIVSRGEREPAVRRQSDAIDPPGMAQEARDFSPSRGPLRNAKRIDFLLLGPRPGEESPAEVKAADPDQDRSGGENQRSPPAEMRTQGFHHLGAAH